MYFSLSAARCCIWGTSNSNWSVTNWRGRRLPSTSSWYLRTSHWWECTSRINTRELSDLSEIASRTISWQKTIPNFSYSSDQPFWQYNKNSCQPRQERCKTRLKLLGRITNAFFYSHRSPKRDIKVCMVNCGWKFVWKSRNDIKVVQCTRDLVSYYNTVGQIYQNSLRSRLNSPGWEKLIRLNVQEYLFGKQPIHWNTVMSFLDFHTNSYISAGAIIRGFQP